MSGGIAALLTLLALGAFFAALIFWIAQGDGTTPAERAGSPTPAAASPARSGVL